MYFILIRKIWEPSLDFFKAYDRVFLPFLLKVMEVMGFGTTFCTWIRMLHQGARTRFILSKLTTFIEVSFSIRQGDPIAMLLFIIYIEPLLIFIERRICGLRIKNVKQSIEAFCDDVNVVTNDVNDLVIIDDAVVKFEQVSGAILSRTFKCKILGFGAWKNKENWPLPYLSSVTEIKVFGVYIMNSCKSMIKRNWEVRSRKLQQSLFSWSSRYLDSIYQRVEVVNTFALSRIFYVASILPIPKNMIQSIEKSVGNFIWTGKFFRVALHELKLPKLSGGLGLICLDSMSKSLRMSQLFRLLKNADMKTLNHIDYWIGEALADFHPDLGHCQNPPVIPSFFMNLAEIVTDSRLSGAVTVNNWKMITNRIIYRHYVSQFPQTKVEDCLMRSIPETWRKLCSPAISSSIREILFLLVHNKLPICERLFRVGKMNDPYCSTCMDLGFAYICDREHYFCTCEKVNDVWAEVRTILINISPARFASLSDLQWITLDIPKSKEYDCYVWLIGTYVDLVWRIVYGRGGLLRREQVFGYLKYKYKADQLGVRVPIVIPDLGQ